MFRCAGAPIYFLSRLHRHPGAEAGRITGIIVSLLVGQRCDIAALDGVGLIGLAIWRGADYSHLQ